MPILPRAGSVGLLGLLLGGLGCSPSITSSDPMPHGGNLIYFADGKGSVEVVKKGGTSEGASGAPEVSFYFYKEDGTPSSPPPSAGTIAVGKSRKVPLSLKGDALVTPAGPPIFPKGEVDGNLSVELDGTTTMIPLGVR